MARLLVASGVEVSVGESTRKIDIYQNSEGSLILEGIGSVYFDLLDEELSFYPPSE